MTPENSGPVGNGLASDVESGAGQFGATGPAAFAPTAGVGMPEVFAWLGMVQQAFPTPTPIVTDTSGSATPTVSGASPTPSPSGSTTGVPSPTDTPCTAFATTVTCSPTPTPSAAPSVTPPASPTPTPAACTVSSQLALAVDADLDTFPDAGASASLSSCELDTGLGGVAATGDITVVDDSAGSPTFAFHRVVNVGVTAGGASGSIQSTVTGRDLGTGSYRIQQNAHLMLSSGADTLQHASDWTFVLTPSAGWSAPWPAVAGTLTVDGSWGATVNGLTVNAIVTSTTPLTIDPVGCASRVTAGTLQADFATTKTDAKTHRLIVTWTGCGQKTRTLDGQPVP